MKPSRQPPANAVEAEDFESRAAAIAKDIKSAVIKLGVELSATQADEPVGSFAEIDRLVSEQDFQLRQKLNHLEEPRRKSAHRACNAAASNEGRIRVKREPSGRSSCRR